MYDFFEILHNKNHLVDSSLLLQQKVMIYIADKEHPSIELIDQ